MQAMYTPQPIFLTYAVRGRPTAAAVIRGLTDVDHLAWADRQGSGVIPKSGISSFLHAIGSRPHIYADALLGRAIETINNFPMSADFEDAWTAERLMAGPQERGRVATPVHVDSICRALRLREAFPSLVAALENQSQLPAYQIEKSALDVTLLMTLHGLRVDRGRIQHAHGEAANRMQELVSEITYKTGVGIDLASDKSIRYLLFNALRLEPTDYTEGTRFKPAYARLGSIKLEHLEPLRTSHRVVDLVMQGIDCRTRRNAFEEIGGALGPDNCLRPEWDPLGCATGRFTCRFPALQALPERCRDVMVASPDSYLVEVDLCEADLRSAAALSCDPRLQEILSHRSEDLHRRTASMVLGKTPDAIGQFERRFFGKCLNNGILFGLSPQTFARQANISLDRAKMCFDTLRQHFPQLFSFIEQTGWEFLRNGHSRTWFGRHTWPTTPQAMHRGQGVAGAVQGTTSDLLKLAMTAIVKQLAPWANLIANCHDSVLLEVPENNVRSVAEHVWRLMELVPSGFAVPIFAKVRVGRNWRDLEPFV